MKFLVDMPLSPNLAVWLRDHGHDAVHAAELGLHRASDAGVLLRAKGEARTVITADLDYPRLLALSEASDPSVILFRGGDWSDGEVISRLADVLRVTGAGAIEQCVLTVDRQRIRRRKLPIES